MCEAVSEPLMKVFKRISSYLKDFVVDEKGKLQQYVNFTTIPITSLRTYTRSTILEKVDDIIELWIDDGSIQELLEEILDDLHITESVENERRLMIGVLLYILEKYIKVVLIIYFDNDHFHLTTEIFFKEPNKIPGRSQQRIDQLINEHGLDLIQESSFKTNLNFRPVITSMIAYKFKNCLLDLVEDNKKTHDIQELCDRKSIYVLYNLEFKRSRSCCEIEAKHSNIDFNT